MSNRTTLAQLREMSGSSVTALPIDHLAMLLDDVAALKKDAAKLEAKLHDACVARFGEKASAERKAQRRDTGSVTLHESGYRVTCDLPKKVEWDQAQLAAAVEVVRGWGSDPREYVTSVLAVPEAKFNAWPSEVRAVFAPARTVGVGKATFKLSPLEKLRDA